LIDAFAWYHDGMNERSSRTVLFASGTGLALANAGLFALIGRLRADWGDPGIPFGMRTPMLAMVGALIGLAVAVGAFIWLNRRTIERGEGTAVICAISAIMFLAAIVSPLAGSADNYWNTLMSRGWIVHGQNPYLTTPNLLSFDPLFPLTASAWRDSSVVYGPLWTAAAAIPVLLLRSPEAQLAGMKVLVSLAYVAAGLLIFRRARKTDAPKARLLLALWLLNPMAVFEIGNNAHNEGLLVLALAIFAIGLAERRPDIAVPGLTAAVLVKIWPIALLPALAAMIGADGKRWTRGIAAAAGLTLASFIIVGGPGRLFDIIPWLDSLAFERRFSPGLFLFWRTAASVAGDGSGAFEAAKLAVNLLFVGIAATVAVLLAKRRLEPLTGAQILLFAFLGIVLSWLHPWYLVAAAPIVLYPAAGPAMPRIAVFLILSCFAFASYAFGWGILIVLSIALAAATAAFASPMLLATSHRRRHD
jgi:hypothetical protein